MFKQKFLENEFKQGQADGSTDSGQETSRRGFAENTAFSGGNRSKQQRANKDHFIMAWNHSRRPRLGSIGLLTDPRMPE
jgi:hypothetical protein